MDIKVEPKQDDDPVDTPDLIDPETVIPGPSRVYKFTKTQKENLQCPSCLETFNCDYLLKVHVMLHDPKQYCFICKRIHQNNFKEHVMNKHFNQCEHCLKTFTDRRTLLRHMELHTGQLTYYNCDQCDSAFRQKASLTIHIRSCHDGLKPYSCKICENSSFTTSSALNKHMKKFHDRNELEDKRSYKCSICPEMFQNSAMKRIHEAEHQKTKSCEKCNESFESTLDMRRHFTQIHASTDLLACEFCWLTFKSSNHLNRHIDTIHDKVESFICQVCDTSFLSSPDLNRHRKLKSHNMQAPTDKDLACAYCLKTFSTVDEKTDHIAEHALLRTCEFCNKKFAQLFLLHKHVKRVHSLLKCPHCSQLTAKHRLKDHIAKVHKERKCNYCPEVFYSFKEYRKHTGAHKERKCEICSQVIPKRRLRHHMDLHRKGLIAKCTICNKLSNNIKLHTQIHKCFICNTKFSTSKCKSKHYEKFHPDTITCGVCREKVLTSQLRIHMKEKHNLDKMIHNCYTCLKVFSTFQQLQRHEQRYHWRVDCRICAKRFPHREDFREHDCEATTHHCHLCDVHYLKPFNYNEHMIQHHSPVILESDRDSQDDWQEVRNGTGIKYQCKKCYRLRESKDTHLCHAESSYDYYQCRLCGFLAACRKTLKKHAVRIHDGEKDWIKIKKKRAPKKRVNSKFPYKCKQCGRRFKLSKFLDVHRCPGRYSCHLCDRKYSNIKSYNYHMRLHHSPRILMDVEQETFLEEKRFLEATILNPGRKRYQCKKCLTILIRAKSVKKHFCGLRRANILNSDYMRSAGVRLSGIRRRDKKVCNDCGFMCLRLDSMEKHISKYHTIKKEELKRGYPTEMKEQGGLLMLEDQQQQLKMDIEIKEESAQIDNYVQGLIKSEDQCSGS